MTTDRDVDRIVRSWLEEGVTALPDRVLDSVLDKLPMTPQRRAWWPARRFPQMNTITRFAVVAAAVAAVAVVGVYFLPGQSQFGAPGPTASPVPTAPQSPTASPVALVQDGTQVPLPAGTYFVTPFRGRFCMTPPQAGCSETDADDSIRFTFTVPEGWEGPFVSPAGKGFDGPDGASLIFVRGSSLFSEPCGMTPPPDIPVGPSVDDFADALAAHPLLDVTDPVDVTLDGYSGKYVDLQVPSDISECPTSYWPWEPGGIYAQGPSHRWHLWVLDVDGVRAIVQSMDYPGTSAEHQAELRAIVDSIQIEP